MSSAWLACGAFPFLVAGPVNDGGQVQPVRRALAGTVGLESARTSLHQPGSPDAVTAGSMCQADTDLRESLPQVPFLHGTSLPASLENLMGGKGPALLHQDPRELQRLQRRQRLFRHRLDTHGAVGQGTTQRVSRPRLTRATGSVPVARHSRNHPERPIPSTTSMQPMV